MKNIVVVDIDGTISKIGDRLKYLQQEPKDWDSFYNDCFEDEPILEICQLVKSLSNDELGYNIIFCTGRRESVRNKTIDWIHGNVGYGIYDQLLMRKNDDHRHDTEVKPELLKNNGITVSDVAFILEDRNSMVKKWRELGFTCLQVAEGDF